MLSRETAVLVLVDIQEKLLPAVHGADELLAAARKLAAGCRALQVPILHTEQYPKGLGPTCAGLQEVLGDAAAVEKTSFGCGGEPAFSAALEALDRRQVVVAGIEAHVCVCQTALQLLDHGFEVHLATDAVASRTRQNRDVALRRMEAAGVEMSSVEMALFEMLGAAAGAEFKAILEIVK